ncbi:MAG TPA: DUF87 domain-containing protein [Anaerolineales bacterium]|nr:DUF87 domain-containing protein [Anaerolineales bacterium]
MIETGGKFYLGKFDDSGEPLLYDPADLTTHAVVVGMTGSGKTGLCLGLLEEAALNNVPAIMIDPKGDITNALLHFPDLLPSDFQPWVNPDEARREGKTVEQAAADASQAWKEGLASWEIGPDRLRALKDSAEFTVYTPGSDAGVPVSILASLQAPKIPWESNTEVLREQIGGTVTALLGLVGLQDIDPLRSREHILLANIFEHAWSRGADLDMGELILQVQTPPFDKLGVFEVGRFFPDGDRFNLAMLLNNILAAPTFQVWTSGAPLDIQTLLYTQDGRPRHSVFYVAHLTDAERMFFITLLYSAVESWMRGQSGTSSLRAIVYFDEIFGYLPPTANPPSKPPMLRLLKQARAFGVAMLLVTQNPADLDYKALTNAGTWFIGRLQADRDKQRLLDGLQGAAAGSLDRGTVERLISGLGKRRFLLHNVHEKQPHIFQTRWAMNYMAGPLTRTQIPALNVLAGVGTRTGRIGTSDLGWTSSTDQPAGPHPGSALFQVTAQPASVSDAPTASHDRPSKPAETSPGTRHPAPGTSTKPALPARVNEFFLPHKLTLGDSARKAGRELPADARSAGLIYRPVLLAQANVRFVNRTYNLNMEKTWTGVVVEPDARGIVRWEEHLCARIEPRGLDPGPLPTSTFGELTAPLTDERLMKSLDTDFSEWIYRAGTVTVRTNPTLKIHAGPDVSEAEFRRMSTEEAARLRDKELATKTRTLETRIKSLSDKLSREERELEENKDEVAQRRMEEYGTHAENLLSLFNKRRRTLTTSLSKRRMTSQAKADVDESLDTIKRLQEEIVETRQELDELIASIKSHWSEALEHVDEIPVAPYKKDILVELFGVAWLPYLLVESSAGTFELPGFDPVWQA